MRFTWPLALLFLYGSAVQAQDLRPAPPANLNEQPLWLQLLYGDQPDAGAVIDAYHDYHQSHPFQKNGYTQYLKRWLREQDTYQATRNDEHAPAEVRQRRALHERRYLQARGAAQGRNDDWSSLGPYDWDHEAAGRSYAPGAAHVYTVEQCPQNGQILYAGTATTGLWKSTNGGAYWTLLTADLMVNEVYAIEISPSDCQTIFASMLNGIYRSTDGGASWEATGDADFQALDLHVRDIRIHAQGNGALFAATEEGLWRSYDNGDHWQLALPGYFWEIEFHPADPSIVYAVAKENDRRTVFFRSQDGGNSFVPIGNGWPEVPAGEENKRAEIAVSPAAPERVVALLTGAANGGTGLYGVYVSDDAGLSWSFACCGPQPGGWPDLGANPPNLNLMGWADDGSDDGGQYYYDLALAISPTDADHILAAGVNLWVSTDGGVSFTCPAKWSHSYKPNYVHADIHDVHYYPNGQIWIACDGGIFRSDDGGATYQRRMTGITGTDFWGFGAGFWDETTMIGGAYHNGTLLRDGDTYENEWLCTDGGDGVGGAVNPGIGNQAYSNYNIKTLGQDRTVEPLTRPYAVEPSWTYVAGKFDQIEFAADAYGTHYLADGTRLLKTEDDNQTVTEIHDFGNEEVTEIEVAWNDPQTIYVATWPGYWDEKHVYRSTDGGLSWTDITPMSFNNERHIPYDLEVSPDNPHLVWLARVGRPTDDDQQVFRSEDGGESWTNISGEGLAGETLTNIVYQRGTDEGLYVGTTRTVYYRNASQSDWQLFGVSLPASTRSRQLVINYRSGTLLNATNRSVWSSPLYEASTPHAQISVNQRYRGCARDTFYFVDHSALGAIGASWAWSFPGATYVSDAQSRTPKVVYGTPGTYSVSLSVSDVNGEDQQTLTDFITVDDDCAPVAEAGLAFSATDTEHYLRTEALNLTGNELTFTAWIKPRGTQADYAGILFHETEGAGLNFRENNELGYHWLGGSTHWAWSSGLYVPADEWSFVAMVVTPEGVTFYLNDEMVHREISLDAVQWTHLHIGRYKDWWDRNFAGELDEVTVWSRALSRDEIRDWRHLTRVEQATPGSDTFDAGLLCYYQFDEAGGSIAYNRVGPAHATVLGQATRIPSTAPVGPGSSTRMEVNAAGAYAFPEEGLAMAFPETGVLPEGEIVVNRLLVAPHGSPADPVLADQYWIINNYGDNVDFSELAHLTFTEVAGITAEQAPGQFQLFQRFSHAEGDTWGAPLAMATATDAQTITFGLGNGVVNFGQCSLGRDASVGTSETAAARPDWRVYPNPLVADWLHLRTQLPGASSLELFDGRGRLLRRTTFSGSADLHWPELPAGVYVYRLRSGETSQRGLLVKP